MTTDVRALLLQVSIGLGTIADACERLLDIEVAASTCRVADRLQMVVDGALQGARVDEGAASLLEAITELQALLANREGRE